MGLVCMSVCETEIEGEYEKRTKTDKGKIYVGRNQEDTEKKRKETNSPETTSHWGIWQ